MITIYKPPVKYQKTNNISIFLAGSIEMGKAIDWQNIVTNSLIDYDIDILNPRRDDWNPDWVQSKTNPQFREQVEWELDCLRDADIIFMYFQPGTISPISLLELGLFISTNKCIVVCPKEFYRHGNIDIVCERFNTQIIPDIETGIIELKRKIIKTI